MNKEPEQKFQDKGKKISSKNFSEEIKSQSESEIKEASQSQDESRQSQDKFQLGHVGVLDSKVGSFEAKVSIEDPSLFNQSNSGNLNSYSRDSAPKEGPASDLEDILSQWSISQDPSKKDYFQKISGICSQKELPKNFTLEDLKGLDKSIVKMGRNCLYEKSHHLHRNYYEMTSPFRKQEDLEIIFNPPEAVTVTADAENKVPDHMIDFKKHFQEGPYSHLFLASVQIPKGTHLIKTVKFEGDLYDQGWGNTSYSGLLCHTITPNRSFSDDLLLIDRNDKKERNHSVVYEGLNMLSLQKVPVEDSLLEIYLYSPPFSGFAAETKGFKLTLTLIKNEYK